MCATSLPGNFGDSVFLKGYDVSIQNQVVCTLAIRVFVSYGVIFGDVIYDNDCYFVYSICITAFYYILKYT